MKKLFLNPFIIFLFFFGLTINSSFANSKRSSESFFHIFAGVEHNIDVLGTLRIGHKNFEAGILNKNFCDTTIGIAYMFNVTSSIYTELGLASVSEKPGIFTAIGFEYPIFGFIDFRAELNASSSYDNFSNGGFILGANFAF